MGDGVLILINYVASSAVKCGSGSSPRHSARDHARSGRAAKPQARISWRQFDN